MRFQLTFGNQHQQAIMKKIFLVLITLAGSNILFSQSDLGLQIDGNQIVLFGNDTIVNEPILLWHPTKGALRSGLMENAWNYPNIGNLSTAFGSDTQASGNYSLASGLGNYANSFVESSLGQYSLGGGNKTVWVSSDPVFEIGNGFSGSNRSNLFTIQKNGNVFIGNLLDPNLTIGERLVVDGGVTVGNTSVSNPLNGTIRYNGTDVEARVNGSWQSLTSGSSGVALWTKSTTNLYPNFDVDVGIGTTNPSGKLTVSLNTNNTNDFVMSVVANSQNKFVVRANGGVSIGNFNLPPVNGLTVGGNVQFGNFIANGYKLSVDGKIICEEVRVQSSLSWPDYVFENDYKLMSIQELEESIKTNKHLPGIPSAKEIKENGQAIADIQKSLLEKIEELTLYIIDQEKRIQTLENQLKK